jgi:magnesium transporter
MPSRRHRRSIATRVGHSPGALIAPRDAQPTRFRWIRYDAQAITIRDDVPVDELPTLVRAQGVHWVDVVGIATIPALERLRDLFHIPYLALADVVNIPQRPRFEVHKEGALMILQIPRPGDSIDLDQLSLFLTGGIVLSFREHEDGLFAPLVERAKDAHSRVRANGADYLAYRLLDVAVDSYFPHVDRLADRLDAIEQDSLDNPTAGPLRDLYSIRRDFGVLLRAALPSRDVLASCAREHPGYFLPETQPYIRDVFDHLAQVSELAQHHRQAAVDIQELIVANLDLRMNQVMKVLTAVTVIFIPLSFITGLYGMNFKAMPELDWRWGYPLVLALIFGIGLTIFWRLKRAGWVRLRDE